MAIKDTFHKTLVYFGLAEEHDVDSWDESAPTKAESRNSREARGTVTRFPQRSRRDEIVAPKSFNDAQDVGDRFRDGVPVIINLQDADPGLAIRVIDFASGLTYALEGGMQRIADKVFVVTPRNVEFSAEQRAEMIEKGFFNQS